MNRRAFVVHVLAAPLVAMVVALRPASTFTPKALGVSVRFLADYDAMSNYPRARRIDILYGWSTTAAS